MSFSSYRTGIPGVLFLTGILTATATGQESAPVPLIIPFEKSGTSPAGHAAGDAARNPSLGQAAGEPVPDVPENASALSAEPVPVEGDVAPYGTDLPALIPEDHGDLPAMDDIIAPETDETEASWLVPGMDRPFGESSLLPSVPDGFDGAPGSSYFLRPRSGAKTELEISARTSLMYDSNVRRSGSTAGGDKEDWIMTVAPGLSYGWKAGHWTGDVAARVGYDFYANNDGMGGLGYSVATGVEYDGGRWQAGAALGSSLTNGGNRYLGDYSEQLQYYSAINASYQISPKTLLDGSLSYRLTEPESGDAQRTEAVETVFSALWKYSRLLELGPGLRYRWESGESSDDRVTVGPLLRTRYRLTGKTALDSDIGINFFDVDGSDGGSDTAPFARLGVHYEMNRIWAFDFSLGKDSVADEAGGFRDTFQMRAGVSRPIRRASWRLGLGYEKIDRNGTLLDLGDTTSFSVDTALMMKIFGDRADAELFVLWRDQQDDGGSNGDWSGTQVGLSLGAKF